MDQVDLINSLQRAGIYVEWVAQVTKTNDAGQGQRRFIALTKSSVVSIKKPALRTYTVRRTIPLSGVKGLIRTPDSSQFVLKVIPTERNDYLYSGNCFAKLRERLQTLKPNLKVWTVEGDITRYRRTKYKYRNMNYEDIDSRPPEDNHLSEEILVSQEDY